MRRVAAERLVDPQQDRPRLRPFELELAFADVGLDAIERGEEVGLPRRPAVFAVGNGLGPAASCFPISTAISRSSIALSCSGVISPFSRLARASLRAAERSRLPT